jgi:copper transport protein
MKGLCRRLVAVVRHFRMQLRRLFGAATVCAAGALAVLVAASPASAHAQLQRTVPAATTVVDNAPREVRLTFSEIVEPAESLVLVRSPDGQAVSGTHTTRDPADARTLVTTLPSGLPVGTYSVSWRILSLDGHPVASTYRYALRKVTAPLTGGRTTFGPSVLGGTSRALADVGLLALVGLVGTLLMVRWRGEGDDAWSRAVLRRLRPALVASAAIALAGTALLVLDTVGQTRGWTATGSATHVGALKDFLSGSRSGRLLSFRVVGLAVLSALLLGAYRAGRTPSRAIGWSALALSTALIGTVSMSSHASTATADTGIAVALDWTHLVAAGAWTGGLLALGLAVMPVTRRSRPEERATAVERAGIVTSRFSAVAQVSMLLVLVTGSYAVLEHVSRTSQLGSTAWGGELLAKVALWVTVLMVASANTATLVPRMTRRTAAVTARLTACSDLASVVRVELAAAAALVTVAAVLAATAPPDQLVS